MSIRTGTEWARTRAGFWGSVDRGWRVATLPSPVGRRARVPGEEKAGGR
jgi:hypothetical protein